MPAYGFYRRVFFCGLIVGLLSAIILPQLEIPGFIGVLAKYWNTIGFLALTLGTTAALNFWALGPLLWFPKSRFRAVGTRLLISLLTTAIFLTEMRFAAERFSVPLGLDMAGLLQTAAPIFAYTSATTVVVCYLVPDKTPEKHKG
jgi:hypothetical protein